MKYHNGRVRLWLQPACFLIAVALLGPFAAHGKHSRLILQTSPFTALCTIIAERTIGAGLGIGLLIAVLALFRKRWFCRYLCPTGFLLEKCQNVGLRKSFWSRLTPNAGRYVALATVIGAIFGYPFLLWMDPLAIFSSAIAVFFVKSLVSAILLGIIPVILIVVSLYFGSFWCGRLCPLGGIQDLLFSAKSSIKTGEKKGDVSENDKKSLRTILPLRRAFLLSVIGAGAALWSKRINASEKKGPPLRPPGAVSDREFPGICMRCGTCMRVCPSRIIHPDNGGAGVLGFLAPVLDFHRDYCRENCNACTQACPSGALQPLDIPSKQKYRIGEARVNQSLCLLVLGENDCNICERVCPFKAVQIHWDEDRYLAYPLVDAYKCNGCGACEAACPTGEIKAIRILRSLAS